MSLSARKTAAKLGVDREQPEKGRFLTCFFRSSFSIRFFVIHVCLMALRKEYDGTKTTIPCGVSCPKYETRAPTMSFDTYVCKIEKTLSEFIVLGESR